jgi:plastocyanin
MVLSDASSSAPRASVARVVLATIAALIVLPMTSALAVYEVAVDDNSFAPEEAKVAAGGQVHWSRAIGSTGTHNVHQDDALFHSGPVTSGPIDYTITVSAGTYHYFCQQHGSQTGGMDGVVKGKIKILDVPAGLKFTVGWATDGTDTGSAFDVQYKVGAGDWKNWKNDTSQLEDVFGQDGDPVPVRADKTYRFRARSQEGVDVSGWSPVRTVHT